MYKLLTVFVFVAVLAIFSIALQSCNSNKNSNTTVAEETIIETEGVVVAYYFHATRRCETCEAVEKVAKATINENYKGKVEFVSINREEDKNKAMVEKYEVNGQTLMLVKGDKKIDLTSPAFMYARTKPEKLEAKLKSTIDGML